MRYTNKSISEEEKKIIDQWIPKVRTSLKTNASRFTKGKITPFVLRYGGKKMELKLANSITAKPKIKFGDVYAVSFSFERHGVFVSKGVGRSNGIDQGFILRGGKGRRPVDWFNPVIEIHAPELADKLAEIHANATVETVSMKIL